MASLGFHCATPPPHGASTSPPPSMELWLQAPSRSGSDLGAARRGLASLLEAPSPSLRSCGSILCSARCLRSTTCSARRCSSPSSASTLAAPSAAPAPAPSPSASPSPTSTPPSSSARRLRSGRCLPAALRCSARRRSSCSPRLAWPVSARTSTSWRAAASPRRGARGARHRRFAASSPTFSGSSTARFGSQTRPQRPTPSLASASDGFRSPFRRSCRRMRLRSLCSASSPRLGGLEQGEEEAEEAVEEAAAAAEAAAEQQQAQQQQAEEQEAEGGTPPRCKTRAALRSRWPSAPPLRCTRSSSSGWPTCPPRPPSTCKSSAASGRSLSCWSPPGSDSGWPPSPPGSRPAAPQPPPLSPSSSSPRTPPTHSPAAGEWRIALTSRSSTPLGARCSALCPTRGACCC
mmetsp:Transcript_19703/g.64462  ORF Transcript_19703/g.64462 Transcript_19703/m.64462 type:complete len:405 (+) Transcript_19703:306-1520(+)